MKIGDLVKTSRASLGVPVGTAGLIVGVQPISSTGRRILDETANDPEFQKAYEPYALWEVLLQGRTNPRRYLGRDLEVINES